MASCPRFVTALCAVLPLAGCPREEARAPQGPTASVPARPVQRPAGMPLREYLAQEEDRWMNAVSTRLYDKFEKGGVAALGKDELTFLRAERLGMHLNRGGLSDYYTSPWADDPAAVRATLAEVGAPVELGQLLEASRAAFGQAVPASAEERNAVIAALAKKQLDPFAQQDAAIKDLLYPYADAVAGWARGKADVLQPSGR